MKEFWKVKFLLADKAYDAEYIREALIQQDIQAVIPPKCNRIDKSITYDKELYKDRNVIERNWLFLKHFRRVFTRYDKLDVNYSGFILLGYIVRKLQSF